MNAAQNIRSRRGGFTLIEVLAVMAVVGIVAAMAVASTTSMMRGYRLMGDAQGVNNLVSLAKMRAASQFSRARVYVDLTTNSCSLQVWDKAAATCVTEGGVTQASTGVSFGFGDLDTPPPDTQAEIGQSPVCTDDDGEDIEDTACVTFNSRGMPVD